MSSAGLPVSGGWKVPFAVVGVAVVLLALYRPTATGEGPIEKVTRAERTAPLAESPPALSRWAKGGGAEHVVALARQSDEYNNSLLAKDVTAFVKSCADLVAVSDAAARFPAPPGGTSSRLWATTLEEYRTAGAICTEVMTSPAPRPGRLELSRSHWHNANALLNAFAQPFAK